MMCSSSIGKTSRGPMEDEDVRFLERKVDLMGSRMDIKEFTMWAGRQFMRAVRALELWK